jgi:undecaprenyl-diphosphatase
MLGVGRVKTLKVTSPDLNLGEASALGLLQGVAEFLPISSSGHLTLAGDWFGVEEPPVALNLALHLATLLVIVVYYRKKMASVLYPFDFEFAKAIVITSVPTAILGLGIKKGLGDFFSNALMVSALLAMNGLALIGLTIILRRRGGGAMESQKGDAEEIKFVPNVKQALVIGVVQGFAALPGISRSGSTIGASRLMGIPALAAAEYSLLASIPVILGAALLELKDLDQFTHLGNLMWGSLVAVLSGWISVGLLLKIVNKNAWMIWGIYCIAVGLGYGVFRYG